MVCDPEEYVEMSVVIYRRLDSIVDADLTELEVRSLLSIIDRRLFRMGVLNLIGRPDLEINTPAIMDIRERHRDLDLLLRSIIVQVTYNRLRSFDQIHTDLIMDGQYLIMELR